MDRLQLEILEERACPSAPTYHGGPIIQDPAVATLFVGAYNPIFDQAVSVAVANYTQILGVFGVHNDASRNGTVTIGPTGPLTNQQVGSLLGQEIAANVLPQPLSPNQMYMVFLDQGSVSDIPNAGAYHTWTTYNGTPIAYTVCFLTGPNAGPYGIFHEYAEATTDPFPGWAGHEGWYTGNYQEIADLANGASFSLDGFPAATVVGPNGQLITGPTSVVTTNPPPQPPTQPPVSVIDTTTFGVNLFNFFEQEITALESLWQSWLTEVVSLETQLWNQLGFHLWL